MKHRGLLHIVVITFLVAFLISYGLTVVLTGVGTSDVVTLDVHVDQP